MLHNKYFLLFLFLLISLNGCDVHNKAKYQDTLDFENNELKKNVPQKIKKLENLDIYATNFGSTDTVEFDKKQIFESSKDVFIEGYTGAVAVDNQNRVYIEGSVPGTVSVYVFKQNGEYITTIGRYGKGPGEFLVIGEIQIRKNELYIYDNHQQKLSVFSLNNFSLAREMIINKDKVENDIKLASLIPRGNFVVNKDGTFLMDFTSKIITNDGGGILYYQLSKDGYVLPGMIIDLKKYYIYNTEMKVGSNGNPTLPFTTSFTRSSLIAFSDQGLIYIAWTDHFLIKVYDKEGNYIRAFYYPYENSKLSISSLNISESRRQIIREESSDMSRTWPALHTLFIDDKNQLWVLTITDSDSTFEGWLLNKKGELLAKFRWPGKRAQRFVKKKPLFLIKNGYLYTRERNLEKGIDRIVKYKIVFKER